MYVRFLRRSMSVSVSSNVPRYLHFFQSFLCVLLIVCCIVFLSFILILTWIINVRKEHSTFRFLIKMASGTIEIPLRDTDEVIETCYNFFVDMYLFFFKIL